MSKTYFGFWSSGLRCRVSLVGCYQHVGRTCRLYLQGMAIRSSEKLVTIYKTTWRHNPEDHIHIFTAVKTSILTRNWVCGIIPLQFKLFITGFTRYLPPLEPVLQEVEERLLHHVRDLVALEGRTDEDDRPHGGNHIIGGCGFLLLEERFPLLFSRWRRERCLAEPGIRHRIWIFTCSIDSQSKHADTIVAC